MGKKGKLSIKWGIPLVIVGLVIMQTEAFPAEFGLGFPFESGVINELMSFGVPRWGTATEDHFGIDLIPRYKPILSPLRGRVDLHKVKVVAPANGTIRAIWAFDSGDYGVARNKDITVILEMNGNWSIILMFEPKTPDFLRGAVEEQLRSITVKAGQHVKTGDEIGYLVVGGTENYYPHVHYALLYKQSREYDSYFKVMSDIDAVPNYSPDEIGVPRTGAGSPWKPMKLNLPDRQTAAFFCPYEFSTREVQNIFRSILENSPTPCGWENEPGQCSLGKCNCVCIYKRCCEGKCCP